VSSRILFERRGSSAIISFNNPSSLNAITTDMLTGLRNALEQCERSKKVSIVILRGVGGKAFSAGADIHVFDEFKGRADAERFWRVTALQTHTLIEKIDKPVVAVVEGYCLGGGLEIAICCDYILATEDSKLGFPEVNLGLIPGWGGTQRIARIVGRQKAKELVMLGEPVTASEAQRLGIVNKVVPREALENEVQSLVEKLSARSRKALASAKLALNMAYEVDLAVGLSRETELDLSLIESDEARRKIREFMERGHRRARGKSRG